MLYEVITIARLEAAAMGQAAVGGACRFAGAGAAAAVRAAEGAAADQATVALAVTSDGATAGEAAAVRALANGTDGGAVMATDGKPAAGFGRGCGVITSYSIHYTKLYDMPGSSWSM